MGRELCRQKGVGMRAWVLALLALAQCVQSHPFTSPNNNYHEVAPSLTFKSKKVLSYPKDRTSKTNAHHVDLKQWLSEREAKFDKGLLAEDKVEFNAHIKLDQLDHKDIVLADTDTDITLPLVTVAAGSVLYHTSDYKGAMKMGNQLRPKSVQSKFESFSYYVQYTNENFLYPTWYSPDICQSMGISCLMQSKETDNFYTHEFKLTKSLLLADISTTQTIYPFQVNKDTVWHLDDTQDHDYELQSTAFRVHKYRDLFIGLFCKFAKAHGLDGWRQRSDQNEIMLCPSVETGSKLVEKAITKFQLAGCGEDGGFEVDVTNSKGPWCSGMKGSWTLTVPKYNAKYSVEADHCHWDGAAGSGKGFKCDIKKLKN